MATKYIIIITDASSISLHHRRHPFVSLVSDNAIYVEARPYTFRRMEINEKQMDRWNANHGMALMNTVTQCWRYQSGY